MRPNWSHIFLRHFGGDKNVKEKGREEDEKKKRKKRRKVWIYDFEFGHLFRFAMVFVWILVDLLKVGLVIPYFVQDELGILP